MQVVAAMSFGGQATREASHKATETLRRLLKQGMRCPASPHCKQRTSGCFSADFCSMVCSCKASSLGTHLHQHMHVETLSSWDVTV